MNATTTNLNPYQASAGGTAADNELVAFRIGEQEFCIDIMSVRDSRGWSKATPLPHSPDYVRGVINLRGTVLPVIDLAVRFGLGAREPTARSVIIVTQAGGRLVGLLVDAVSDILATQGDNIQPTPDVASDLATSFIRGVIAIDNRMISLVELSDVLPQSVGGVS